MTNQKEQVILTFSGELTTQKEQVILALSGALTTMADAANKIAEAANKLVDYTVGSDYQAESKPMTQVASVVGIAKDEQHEINRVGGSVGDHATAPDLAATPDDAAPVEAKAKPKRGTGKPKPEPTPEPQPDPKPSKDEPAEAEAQDLLTIGDTVSEESTDNVAETKESNAETKESIAEATGVTLASITAALSRAISAGSIVKTDVKTWLEDFDVKALSDLDADQRDAFYNKHSDILGELK